MEKKSFEDLKNEDVSEIKNDKRAIDTFSTLGDFKKLACKKCNGKLNKFILKLLWKRDESLISDFIDKKLCDKCKELVK